MSDTYWNNRGKHQADYVALTDLLIPASGRSETTHGELLRGAAKVYRDYYNNGLCNADTPDMLYRWGCVVAAWDEEVVAALGEHGQDLWTVNRAIERHRVRLAKNGGMYVENFPVEELERVMDAVIEVVKAVSAPTPA
jgi:hypothetical protein